MTDRHVRVLASSIIVLAGSVALALVRLGRRDDFLTFVFGVMLLLGMFALVLNWVPSRPRQALGETTRPPDDDRPPSSAV
jgi:hypothetical protein